MPYHLLLESGSALLLESGDGLLLESAGPIVSAQSGNWSDPTTWVGGVVPGSADTVSIAAGTVVTVDVAASASTVSILSQWGGSPSASIHALLIVDSPLNVTATSGVAFTYSSYETAPAVMLTLGPGGSITFNPAAGETVTLQLGNSSNASVIHADGTGWGTGQFCEFANAGAGTLAMAYGTAESAQFVGSYVKFTGVNGGIAAYLTQAGNPGFLLDHARFSGCGQIAVTAGADVPFRLNDVRFSGCTDPNYSATLGVAVPSSGIERTHNEVAYLDKPLFVTGSGLGFTNCYFANTLQVGASQAWSGLDSCLILYSDTDYAYNFGGDVTNSYLLYNFVNDNPLWMLLPTNTPTGTVPTWSVTGNVFDGPAVTSTGDEGQTVIAPSDRPLVYTGNVVLPIVSGPSTGRACSTGISCAGGPGLTVTAEHNTIIGSVGYPAFYYGESATPHAGMYGSVRSNLVVDLADLLGGSTIFGPYGGDTSVDVAAAADVTNNGGYNLKTGASGVGYSALFSAGTPGAGDVHADPNLLDPTRSLAGWAVSQGSTSSTLGDRIADGLAYLLADLSLIGSSLMPWVRAGAAPTNAAFHNTAHDGTDIGAVEYAGVVDSPATGTATGSASISGVGGSVADAVATASGAGAASGVGGSIADAAGTASGTSSASGSSTGQDLPYFERDLLAYLNGFGLRVYPGKIPQTAALPALCFFEVGADHRNRIGAAAGVGWAKYQVTLSSRSYIDVGRGAEQLRLSLQGYVQRPMGRTWVSAVLAGNQFTRYDAAVDGSDNGVHSKISEFTFFLEESIPTFDR